MGQNTYAFPTHPDIPTSADGMTLRDYFAAKAMQSLLPRLSPEDLCMEDIASFAYFMADHMIEERERDDTDS